MRKTRLLAISALVLATLGILLLLLLSPGEREPVYQGKTLTYWLSDVRPGRNPTPEQMERDKFAVRQIGTNAFPMLLEWISANDGPLKRRVVYWIYQHPWVPFRLESSVDMNLLAGIGFRILGKSQAAPAVPALVKIVTTGGSEKATGHNENWPAMWVLAYLDREAATKAGVIIGTNDAVTGWSKPPATANK